jgi:hypothetical protein
MEQLKRIKLPLLVIDDCVDPFSGAYPIPIFDENGDWLENINIVDDIGDIRVLESRKIETSDWQLNEAIKFYAKNLICDYMPATVVNYWRAVVLTVCDYADVAQEFFPEYLRVINFFDDYQRTILVELICYHHRRLNPLFNDEIGKHLELRRNEVPE